MRCNTIDEILIVQNETVVRRLPLFQWQVFKKARIEKKGMIFIRDGQSLHGKYALWVLF